MSSDTATLIALLQDEITADQAAQRLGCTRRQLWARRRRYLRGKLPKIRGTVRTAVSGPVEILRDRWGIPHVAADSVADGIFGLGYAMAQDRLWQLDHMRRLASGRLAEVLGRSYVGQDRLHRTLGLRRSAQAALDQAGDEVRSVLEALAAGINAGAAAAPELPLEFDLLGYAPEPWTPVDSVAVWKWRWWMLTGRLNVLGIAEAGKRHLTPERFRAFMTSEAGDETIVPGDAPAAGGGHDTGEGSNNWVVGGSLSASGKPILATDPHNGVDLSRQWYQAQLTVPGIDAVGAFFLGTPGIYLGHTRHTAWGVTNHTASARDVYAETPGPDGDSYLEDGVPQPYEQIAETIAVRDGEDETLVVRRTRRGPLVNDLVDGAGEAPMSLRWQGSEPTTGFEAMLALLRSRDLGQALAALESWPFPILNFVLADDGGRIAYHAAGQVPVREKVNPGFRRADDPGDAWARHYDFDEMPHLVDPARDWVASANNPPWGGDHPYLHLGAWADGYRFRRIRGRMQARSDHTLDSVGAIHADIVHGRAQELAPIVAAIAAAGPNARVRDLGAILADWDGAYGIDAVAPTVFTAFWQCWLARVAAIRFPADVVPKVQDRCAAVANRLLRGEADGWVDTVWDRDAEVTAALRQTLEWLRERVGSRRSQWRWGRLHTVTFAHPCATTPALEKLLNVGPAPTAGGNGTVRAAGFSLTRPFQVTGLSTYRMVVDLADPAHGRATTAGGQSGHPASPHYRTQSKLWLADDTHPLLMDRADVEAHLEGRLVLRPDRTAPTRAG